MSNIKSVIEVRLTPSVMAAQRPYEIMRQKPRTQQFVLWMIRELGKKDLGAADALAAKWGMRRVK